MRIIEHLDRRDLPCSAVDVLLIVNTVNAGQYSQAADINADGLVSPLDALLAINAVNAGKADCRPAAGILVDLRAYGHDASEPPGLLLEAGTPVVCSVTVANTGIVHLREVSVEIVDLVLTNYIGDADQDGVLDPGEAWHWLAAGDARLGLTEISAVAKASALGELVEAVDSVFVFGWAVK